MKKFPCFLVSFFLTTATPLAAQAPGALPVQSPSQDAPANLQDSSIAAAAATSVPTARQPAAPAAEPDPLTELGAFPNLTITEYVIRGSTGEELSKQIDLLGPADRSGKRKDVLTQWNISWRWPGGERGPDYANAEASYTISVMLPRWERPANPDPLLTAKWQNYLNALVSHEKRRAELIAQSTQRVADAIRFGAAGSQRFTAQEANAAANRAVKDIHTRESVLEQEAQRLNIREFLTN